MAAAPTLIDAPSRTTRAVDIVDGECVEKDMSAQGGFVAGRLVRRLGNVVEPAELGVVLTSDAGFQYASLAGGRTRFADASFVRSGRFPGNVPPLRGWTPFPPDIVFEVVSPNDTAEEVDRKVVEWQRGGVELVVLINPASRRLTLLRGRHGEALSDGDTLEFPDIVPGFSCTVTDLLGPAVVESDDEA